MNKEDTLQMNCVNWFRYQFAKYKLVLFSIPNGGFRNINTAKTMKKTGVVAGVADLFLSIPNKTYHGFYIELKIGYNKPTTKQLLFQKQVELFGYKWICVWDVDSFMKEINNYMKDI